MPILTVRRPDDGTVEEKQFKILIIKGDRVFLCTDDVETNYPRSNHQFFNICGRQYRVIHKRYGGDKIMFCA